MRRFANPRRVALPSGARSPRAGVLSRESRAPAVSALPGVSPGTAPLAAAPLSSVCRHMTSCQETTTKPVAGRTAAVRMRKVLAGAQAGWRVSGQHGPADACVQRPDGHAQCLQVPGRLGSLRMVRRREMLAAAASCIAGAGRAASAAPGPAVRVAFLNPSHADGRDIWPPMTRFMQAAAASLGQSLEVLHADRDRALMLEQARELAARPQPPDYVVLVNEKQQAPALMQALAGTPCRLMLIHNDLLPEQREQVGAERQSLRNWIGTLMHADDQVPNALMDALYRAVPGVPRIGGISGDPATPISGIGARMIANYVARAGRGEILQVVPGEWTRDSGREQAQGLLRRYPDLNLLWAANDAMALGALDVVVDAGAAGRISVGCFGGAPEALDSVAAGGLRATAAGPVFSGGWVMVLIHDHANGIDFADPNGARVRHPTAALADDRRSALQMKLLIEHPERVDFRSFARASRPPARRRDPYDFRYAALTSAFRQG